MKAKFGIWLAAVLSAAGPAWAHRVGVFAYAEGKTVMGRGWFGGGARPKNCPVLVYLPGRKLLLETRTDTAGTFRFEAPVRADLRIVLKAGLGHQAEYLLEARELPPDLPPPGGSGAPAGAAQSAGSRPGASGTATATSAPPPGPSRGGGASTRPAAAPARPASPGTGIDQDRLRRLIRGEVQNAIGPLREQIAEANRPGPTEIIGGIGYILGLMGLAAYFRGRALARKAAGKS